MGMYDDITVQYELPYEVPEEGWQTKHFSCTGSLFILTKEGRLLERIDAIELIEDEVCHTGKKKTIDRNFEGVFCFYNVVGRWWCEFEVVMIDGQVKRILRTKHDPLPRH